jgi:hypothetical protein
LKAVLSCIGFLNVYDLRILVQEDMCNVNDTFESHEVRYLATDHLIPSQ